MDSKGHRFPKHSVKNLEDFHCWVQRTEEVNVFSKGNITHSIMNMHDGELLYLYRHNSLFKFNSSDRHNSYALYVSIK